MEAGSAELTVAQRARIEKNRLKAVTLREAKLIPHPSAKIDTDSVQQTIVNVRGAKYVDSGGGFLIEEKSASEVAKVVAFASKPGPIIEKSERPRCRECNEEFSTSYLFDNFDHDVCDGCRDDEDKHCLITKTEAKNEYLLKDCDFDTREPPLKCIVRKNPHNSKWGSMKLYLHEQVEERALAVWGSKDALLAEREQREEKKDVAKAKKYSKKLKELRMNVRSSLFDKTKGSHTHVYGPEEYNEEDDTYTKTCTECDYTQTYEKM